MVVGSMAKAKKDRGSKKDDGTHQIAFRLPLDLYGRVNAVAEGFGLDLSNFLRLMIIQNIGRYEKELEELHGGSE